MTDIQYRAFLDLMMCSDPWPVVDRDGIDSNAILEGLALDEARARGFESWIVAYHEVKAVKEIT